MRAPSGPRAWNASHQAFSYRPTPASAVLRGAAYPWAPQAESRDGGMHVIMLWIKSRDLNPWIPLGCGSLRLAAPASHPRRPAPAPSHPRQRGEHRTTTTLLLLLAASRDGVSRPSAFETLVVLSTQYTGTYPRQCIPETRIHLSSPVPLTRTTGPFSSGTTLPCPYPYPYTHTHTPRQMLPLPQRPQAKPSAVHSSAPATPARPQLQLLAPSTQLHLHAPVPIREASNPGCATSNPGSRPARLVTAISSSDETRHSNIPDVCPRLVGRDPPNHHTPVACACPGVHVPVGCIVPWAGLPYGGSGRDAMR